MFCWSSPCNVRFDATFPFGGTVLMSIRLVFGSTLSLRFKHATWIYVCFVMDLCPGVVNAV